MNKEETKIRYIRWRDLNVGLRIAIAFAWLFGLMGTMVFLIGLFGLPDCFCLGF